MAAAMPAKRNSMGRVNMPWSSAYFSNAATPASNTSMPIFTGTLPTVNQRFTARAASVNTSGVAGGGGVAGRGGGAAAARGVAGIGGGATAGVTVGGTGGNGLACGSCTLALRVSSAKVGSRGISTSAFGT